MNVTTAHRFIHSLGVVSLLTVLAHAADLKRSPVYKRLKTVIDATPSIDTHDHLRPFDEIPGRVKTDRGEGMTLQSMWATSYLTRHTRITPWPASGLFDDWWKAAARDFDDVHAASFYRYLLPAFRDLYGVDFDTITADQARALNVRIFDHYKDRRWLEEVVTRRANIELMFIDCYWARLQFARAYKFSVPLLNVTTMGKGTHASNYTNPLDSPYDWAAKNGMKIDSLDEYLKVLDAIFAKAVAADAMCLKTTLAYERPLRFENVPKERAERAFGKPRSQLTAQEATEFEDFIMWRLVELSAKHDLPFQIHTGDAQLQGSNPTLLIDLIQANPRTKFILFHGGYPWVGETGAMAMRFRNVWIDSCWLPTLSYTMAKRAYQEWLEAAPSNRIMWGADTGTAEGIYGATEFTRQCVAEALSEMVEDGRLREEHAKDIARGIMRENALRLMPRLKKLLWRRAANPRISRTWTGS